MSHATRLASTIRVSPTVARFGRAGRRVLHALMRERAALIAAVRLTLIATALAAAYLSEAGGWRPLESPILWLYLATAVAAAARFGARRRRLPLPALHLIDLTFAASLAFTPGGPVGLFLAAATFCLLAAAVRWNWSAVAATGVALAAAYVAGVALRFISGEQFIIRLSYLLLMSAGVALAVWRGAQLRARLLKVARWTNSRFANVSDGVLRVFRHAADVLDAPRVVVVWREHESQSRKHSVYDAANDALQTHDAPLSPEDTVAAPLRGRAFILDNGRCLTHDGVEDIDIAGVPALWPPEADANGTGVLASAPFTGEICDGRLFALGIGHCSWDQLLLTELVAAQIRARLEGRVRREQSARAGAAHERARLARDLHDGILQSLTAARLQLRAAAAPGAADAPATINAVSELLRDEQSRLRRFVEMTRENGANRRPLIDLRERITTLAAHWGIVADVSVVPADGIVPLPLYREMSFIVAEAIANAVRHAGVRQITAQITLRSAKISLAIAGACEVSGFAVPREPPRSIDERVRELGGSATLERSGSDVILKIEVPLPDNGALGQHGA